MRVGASIAGRFLLRERVGEGGMGQVFRAQDLSTGRVVALKCMSSLEASMVERFGFEARTLASLSHPAIVGHVAHGTSEEGEPFLAMEWLEGQDLSRVLARGPLSAAATLTLLRRVASALGAAHARGVVHRDLKPANIVLVGGAPEGATVVDFGVARPSALTRGITRTGAIVGTVGYMAPEQLLATPGLDGRADLFALGCVAFECLTGRPAFGGENLGAVVAGIVLGQVPRVAELAPQLPGALDELVAKLLASRREERFQSAEELLSALERVSALLDSGSAPTEVPRAASTATRSAERSPAAVVLVIPEESAPTSSDAGAGSSDAGAGSSAAEACEAAAKRWGAARTPLAGGGVLLVFAQRGPLQESARRAARAALELLDSARGCAVSLSLARAVHQHEAPAEHSATEVPEEARAGQRAATGVQLDGALAALLGDEFEVEGAEGALVLTAFVATRDEVRKVLGRSAPCVGRDKELRLLESTLEECAEEGAQRAVLLRAPPGAGKSRVRREFVARLRGRGDLTVLLARSDVGSASVSLGLLRAWLREGLELGGLAESARWERLRERVLPRLEGAPGAPAALVLEFLAELADVAVPSPSAAFLDARSNARAMRRMLELALASWLRAAASPGPLVLVLEDAHWADPTSVSLLCSVWGSLSEVPLLLLVTAWPEGQAQHPALFELERSQVLDLAPLGKRASERLARQLLGEGASAELLARVVDLAGGNAFLLEELVRHVGQGRPLEEFPGSVLALVQARLLALPAEARRLLRTASALGERFHPDAVAAMLGTALEGSSPSGILERLRREELLLSPADERDAEGEWSFRHSLVRRAAYEMLTEEDRARAHRAAAAWLATRSSVDPAVLGSHLEQAGAVAEAAPWLLRAAEQREELGDYEAAGALARRVDRDEVEPALRAEAAYHLLYADVFLGRHEAVFAMDARMARGEIARGTHGWAAIHASLLALKVHGGIPVDVPAGLRELRASGIEFAPSNPTIFTFCLLTVSLAHLGLQEEAWYAAEVLRSITSRADTLPGWRALRDAYVPWLMAMCDDPAALAAHRAAVELALTHCSTVRQYEIVPPYVSFLLEFGAVEEAREHLGRWRGVEFAGDAPVKEFLALGESSLALATGRDCRALLEGHRNRSWKHIEPWLCANSVASAALARPEDPALARACLEELAPLLEDCGPLLTQRNFVLVRSAQCAFLAGDAERSLALLGRVSPGELMPGTRTTVDLLRVRALARLGRAGEAAAALSLARARLKRFSEGLAEKDRALFLAMPAAAALQGLELPAG